MQVSSLQHPFIVPYIESWIHHGHTVNIVYGYCEKGDLGTHISKQKAKPLDEELLKFWVAQMLLALDYMHRKFVLHRDVRGRAGGGAARLSALLHTLTCVVCHTGQVLQHLSYGGGGRAGRAG